MTSKQCGYADLSTIRYWSMISALLLMQDSHHTSMIVWYFQHWTIAWPCYTVRPHSPKRRRIRMTTCYRDWHMFTIDTSSLSSWSCVNHRNLSPDILIISSILDAIEGRASVIFFTKPLHSIASKSCKLRIWYSFYVQEEWDKYMPNAGTHL